MFAPLNGALEDCSFQDVLAQRVRLFKRKVGADLGHFFRNPFTTVELCIEQHRNVVMADARSDWSRSNLKRGPEPHASCKGLHSFFGRISRSRFWPFHAAHWVCITEQL